MRSRSAARCAPPLQQDRPVYIRMGKKGEPVVHKGPIADFAIGKAITVSARQRRLPALDRQHVARGDRGRARTGKDKGISAEVVSFHTVKPLDEARLKASFARFKLVATIEEHSLIGGFGAAVSEWLVDTRNAAQEIPALRHA